MLLEVIASSAADAVEAQRGGAGRIELVRELARGGLTPSLDLVGEVVQAVTIPVRVMVREADGYGAGSATDIDRLARSAHEIAALGVDGIVVGFLRDGTIDRAAMHAILAAAAPVHATFHRAFEELPDPIAALRELQGWPQVDRVLTSGGAGNWADKAARLERWASAAAPAIRILTGGGVTLEALRVLSWTSLEEAHVGRAVRVPPSVEGRVSAEKVAELVETARRATRGNTG